MYRSADGKLYVPGSLPVTLSFSAAGDSQQAPAPAWTFNKEGKQLLNAQGQNGPPVEIYVDLTPPQTVLNFSGAPVFTAGDRTYYGKGLVFTASPNDTLSGVNATWLSVNNAEYRLLDGEYSQFTANTQNTITVVSIDNVGNRESPRISTFFFDTTPPVSIHTVKGSTYDMTGGPVLSPGCTIALSAKDSDAGLKGIYYRLDSGPETKYKKTLVIHSLAAGSHRLTWYAQDNVDNREELRRFLFQFDKKPPDLSLNVQGPQHLHEGTLFISGQSRLKPVVTDNLAGTAAIYYRIDSGEKIDYKNPFLLPAQSGRHKVDLIAADNVDNQGSPLIRFYYLDLTPPESDFKIGGFYTRTGEQFIIRQDVTLELIATDLEAGVRIIRFRLNNGPAQDYTAPINWQKNGAYTLQYWAEDNVGNIETAKTLNLHVETAPAKAGFLKPPARYPKQWYVHPESGLMGSTGLPFFLYFGLTDKDGKAIGDPILLDLKKLAIEHGSPITFEKGGVNVLTVDTRPAGKPYRHGVQSFKVLIDALPPRTSIAFSTPSQCSGKKLPCYGPDVHIRFSAHDVTRGIVSGFKETRVSVDGSPFFSYSQPLQIFSRQKTYTVEYFSVDNVGNAEKPQTVQFTVDATPPVTTRELSGPRSGPILSARSVITLNSGDNLSGVKTIYYAFDEGKEYIYQSPLTGRILDSLSEGKHVLTYYAIDRTGNREDPRAVNILLDHGGPLLRLSVSGEQHTRGSTLFLAKGSSIRFSAVDPRSGVKNIRYRIDKGPVEIYQKPLTAPPVTRNYSLYYNAEDTAGNNSPWQHQSVVVDNTPPVTRLSYDGHVFRDKYRFYAGPRTAVVLQAQDAQSGVRNIQCSIDNQSFQTVKAPFRIKRGGSHKIRFRARDNVGNIEVIRSKDIFIDNTPPILNISYNLRSYRTTEANTPIYPAGLVISITASDSNTEVDKIVYRIDNGREHLYRNPLSEFVVSQDIMIKVTANDRLGNLAESIITFRVEKGEQ